MNVNEAIEYIHSLSKFGKKSGLDNIKILGITDENLSKAIISNKEKINIGKRNTE